MPNADETSQEAPSPIPIPPEFPITWDHRDDEQMFWHTDIMHFPESVTPMMAGFNLSFRVGLNRAAEAYDMPIQLLFRRINTYNYMTIIPRVPPEEMEAYGKRSEVKLGAAVGRL